jgi:uncharacterized membrane protein
MEDFSDMVIFFGRFHPMVVHLPIGFLFLAILLECLTPLRAFEKYRSLLPFIWLLGALSVCLAAVLGYMLSVGGGYEEKSLSWHKWAGISLCLFSFACYFYNRYFFSGVAKYQRWVYAIVLVATSVLLIQTGHLGGTLTHGADYLVEFAPNFVREWSGVRENRPGVRQQLVSLDSADLFDDAVMPIINAKCSGCHNKNKKKGQLVLTSFEEILAGGETAPGVVPGNLARSELYRRITLPPGHEDAMPGEGKTPLSEDQISIIEWWIEMNAPRNSSIAALSPNEGMVEVLENFFGINEAVEIEVPPAGETAIANLVQQGFKVKRLSNNSNLLDVKFNRKGNVKPQTTLLLSVLEQVAWLDLSNCDLTDDDLKPVGSLVNTSKLSLHNNPISDAGIEHLSGLARLEYLNLYATDVTDKSLASFREFENLKRLYIWETKVKNTALIDSLKVHRPDLSVVYLLAFNLGENADTLPGTKRFTPDL